MSDTYHAPTQRDIENIDFLAESMKIAFVAAKNNASDIARKNLSETVLEYLNNNQLEELRELCESFVEKVKRDTLCSHPYGIFPDNDKDAPYFICELCETKILRFSAMYNGKHHRLLLVEPKVGDLIKHTDGDIYRVIPDGQFPQEYQINLKWAKKHQFPVLEG